MLIEGSPAEVEVSCAVERSGTLSKPCPSSDLCVTVVAEPINCGSSESLAEPSKPLPLLVWLTEVSAAATGGSAVIVRLPDVGLRVIFPRAVGLWNIVIVRPLALKIAFGPTVEG